jgi:hypothetical protein
VHCGSGNLIDCTPSNQDPCLKTKLPTKSSLSKYEYFHQTQIQESGISGGRTRAQHSNLSFDVRRESSSLAEESNHEKEKAL